jgi:hypothetical protein
VRFLEWWKGEGEERYSTFRRLFNLLTGEADFLRKACFRAVFEVAFAGQPRRFWRCDWWGWLHSPDNMCIACTNATQVPIFHICRLLLAHFRPISFAA